jgi:quinol monooxygenase YgiN
MTRLVRLVSPAVMMAALLQGPVARAGAAPALQPAPAYVVAFHAVSYVEVEPTTAARTAAVSALRLYQSASRSQDGFIRFEAFEQEGRPGHFAFIETWRDQMAFDARDPAAMTRLTGTLAPIRTSDIDRRPYKTMSVAPVAALPANAVIVITHVDASPTPQLPELLQRLVEDSRRDSGNLRFDLMQHTMRANHFTIIEAWRDRKALDAHVVSPHVRQYREAYGPMAGSPLDERIFLAVRL